MAAQYFLASIGATYSGAKAYTYIKDTTTNQAVYTDTGLTTPAANPVIADAAGKFEWYFDNTDNYSVSIKTSDDSVTLFQFDYVAGAINIVWVNDGTFNGIAEALNIAGWDGDGLPVARSASEMRALLDLEIGTDVQAYDADLTVFADNPLTAAELGQLQNIGSTTITAGQWVYLGNLDQNLRTSDSPTFAGLTLGAVTYPATDGSANQVLTTDGAGTASFEDPTTVTRAFLGLATTDNVQFADIDATGAIEVGTPTAGDFSGTAGEVNAEAIYEEGVRVATQTDLANYAKIVASLAAVKALTTSDISANQFIYMRGRTSIGDGAEGEFYVMSGSASSNGFTADDGIVIENTAGNLTFVRVGYERIDIRFYGAVGDDSTDNTTAVQAWLDTVPKVAGAVTANDALAARGLYLPSGTFQAGKVTYQGYTAIYGDGREKSILKLKDNADTHLMVPRYWDDEEVYADYPIFLYDIGLDGNKANQTSTSIDLLVLSNFQSSISRCLFQNSKRHGVRPTVVNEAGTDLLNGIADCIFTECEFYNNDGAGLFGEDSTTNLLSDLQLFGCIFDANGSTTYAQLEIERAAGVTLNQVRTFGGNATYDVVLKLCGRSSIIGGNYDLAAIGVGTGTANAAAIRIEPAGQSYVNINGAQIMVSPTDNGTTNYNGIEIDGSSDYINIIGGNISTNTSVGQGKALRIASGTLRGRYDITEEGFPDASDTSLLDTRTYFSEPFNIAADSSTGLGWTVTGSVAPLYSQFSSEATASAFQGIGSIRFVGKNDAAEDTLFTQITAFTDVVTDGSERGSLSVRNLNNGIEVYSVNVTGNGIFAGSSGFGHGHATVDFEAYYLKGSVFWSAGSGSPEGAVTAPVGSLYSRTDGGASTTLYVKESGTGNTGWVAK